MLESRQSRWSWTFEPDAAALVEEDLQGVLDAFFGPSHQVSAEHLTSWMAHPLPEELGCTVIAVPDRGLQIQAIGFDRENGGGRAAVFVLEIHKTQEGLEIALPYLEVAPGFQRRGCAPRAAKVVAELADALGITMCRTSPGLAAGGYVWARVGCCALHPELAYRAVVDRLAFMARAGELTLAEVAGLGQHLEGVSRDELIMWRLATEVVELWPQLTQVMAGTIWDGYWDLARPDHRARIEKGVQRWAQE